MTPKDAAIEIRMRTATKRAVTMLREYATEIKMACSIEDRCWICVDCGKGENCQEAKRWRDAMDIADQLEIVSQQQSPKRSGP